MKIKTGIVSYLNGSGKKENSILWKCDKCGLVGFNNVGEATELTGEQASHWCEEGA